MIRSALLLTTETTSISSDDLIQALTMHANDFNHCDSTNRTHRTDFATRYTDIAPSPPPYDPLHPSTNPLPSFARSPTPFRSVSDFPRIAIQLTSPIERDIASLTTSSIPLPPNRNSIRHSSPLSHCPTPFPLFRRTVSTSVFVLFIVLGCFISTNNPLMEIVRI